MHTNISTTVQISNKIARNLGRIICDRLINYENACMKVLLSSETHVYICFYDMSDPKYHVIICRVNIYEDVYNLNSSISTPSINIPVRNKILDAWRIRRWIDKTIKKYRRKYK